MSELFNDRELGRRELTLLAEAILLELDGSGERRTDGAGLEMRSDYAQAGALYGMRDPAAGYDAERAFRSLGEEIGRVFSKNLEQSALLNLVQAAKDEDWARGYNHDTAGGSEKPDAAEKDEEWKGISFLRAGGRDGASWGVSEEKDVRGEGSASGKLGLDGSGLPERLSEIFCRDARRYDGPFDRY